MRSLGVLVVFCVACGHGSDSGKDNAAPQPSAPQTTPSAVPVAAGSGSAIAVTDVAPPDAGAAAAPAPTESDDTSPPGHDFTPTGKVLLAVGACGDGIVPPEFGKELVALHCQTIDKTQAQYKKSWLDIAAPFFVAHVPATVPKKVVYPFAGGDLSTALTVYPDADEITTMSLEPAGDPRALEALAIMRAAPPPEVSKVSKVSKPAPTPVKSTKPSGKRKKSPAVGKGDTPERSDDGATDDDPVVQEKGPPTLEKALRTVEYELRFLYRVNFSNTMNMIDAMRGGLLPTQLIFGLSALKVHGYDVVALRYFKLDQEGVIHYLTDDEVAKAPSPTAGAPDYRNRIFANAEIRFRKPGGRVQIYRHIQVNLDNDHLKKDMRVIRHLESKGEVAGMTKAASYLLSWDSFSIMRNYLIDHVQWMVSDATGIAPRWGKPKGFAYETYGAFKIAHIQAGNSIAKDWRDEFSAEPARKLGFRFGYYDGTKEHTSHLVIIRRKT